MTRTFLGDPPVLLPDGLPAGCLLAADFTALWHNASTPFAILADWCEDHGCASDERLYRWLEKRIKWPWKRGKEVGRSGVARAASSRYAWAWYRDSPSSNFSGLFGHLAFLPRIVFLALPSQDRWQFSDHDYYPSRAAALADLREALDLLTEVLT